ncbi:MAG: DUF2953 domain-containing protein [Eubacteriales bacterium]|nr:DUF2953 domain-containing protein [Eubacteriales bacterium]
MLHIVFTILKIPFILLAVILLLLLLILVLVSFVPVRYRVTAKKDKQIYAAGKVSWLLRIIMVLFEYSEKGVHFQIKLFGYPLLGDKSSKKTGRRKKNKPDQDDINSENIYSECIDSENTVPDVIDQADEHLDFETEKRQGKPEEPDFINDTETEVESDNPDYIEVSDKFDSCIENPDLTRQKTSDGGIFHKILNLWEKIKAFFKGLIEKLRNINETIQSLKSKLNYYKRLWYDDHTQASWRHLKKEVVYVLRHIRPRKVNGWVKLGLDDPALTGQLLGLLCILQGLSGNHLIAEADFEKKMFESDFQLKGHIRLCHFFKVALALLFDKHCRITFKRIRKLL